MKPTLELLTSYNLNLRRIFEETIGHIEFELANYSNPNVEIYVACTSMNNDSKEMAAKYGGCVIRFNWMLPLLAYACPRPFSGSMLSRVSYDEHEFTHHLIAQGFIFGTPELRPQIRDFLAGKDHHLRAASIAASVAANLCVFAVNIKKPEFSYEREWRLKTVTINYSIPTLLNSDQALVFRRALKMSEDAAFRSTPSHRYVQDLRLEERMIIDNVGMRVSPPIIIPELIELLREIHENTRTGFWGTALDQKEKLLNLYAESLRKNGAT